ncbi:MAG: hypothetical protein ACJ75D_05835 [Gaiellaceae bacterium]
MKRHLTVLVASLALLLAAGVGTAYAGGSGLGLPADQTQAIDQSQNATNSIDQSATAQSAAVNVSPNVAIGNKGSVDQSSDASSGAVAVNKNDSEQDNTLSNTAGQTQSGALADDNASHCCGTSKHAPKSQSVQQSQNASNSISQNAESKSVAVNASPNVAVLNKGGDCNCGGGGVEQSSSASSGAVAVNKNRSTQSNTLQNDARQSQGGNHGGKADRSQSIDQSQDASNSIDQNGKATSVAVNASPNVAIGNSGPVKQDSNASSEAVAVNKNDSQQSNTLRNDAGQSQAGSDHSCGRCKHGSAPGSQSIDQSQNATNSISQNAEARSLALNASPNVAVLNGGRDKCGGCGEGGVRQSSNASSGAFAGNWNSSEQSNELGQEARQSQEGGSGSCCHKGGGQSQSIDQSQNATNSIEQNAEAKSVAVNVSPNVAAFNHSSVEQSSGASSEAVAVNKNNSTQSNTLGQSADQQQRGGDECRCRDDCECRDECNPCDECKPCDECNPCEGGCED